MGSGYGGLAEARMSRKNAANQAGTAERKERERQSAIDSNIARVREMFGVDPHEMGDRPGEFTEVAPSRLIARHTPTGSPGSKVSTRMVDNPAYRDWERRRDAHAAGVKDYYIRSAGNLKARENKAKLEGWLDDYSGAVLESNNAELNDQFMASNTANRWALADRGLLGGSVDAGAQRRQISEMVAGRQKAVMAARDARRNAASSLNNQRLNLEQQVSAGTQLNPDFRAFQEQTQMGLEQVRANIAPTAIGNTFTTLGQGAGAAIAQQRTPRTPGVTNVSGSSTGTISRGG